MFVMISNEVSGNNKKKLIVRLLQCEKWHHTHGTWEHSKRRRAIDADNNYNLTNTQNLNEEERINEMIKRAPITSTCQRTKYVYHI